MNLVAALALAAATPADDALYRARFAELTAHHGTLVDYSPLALVAGATPVRPLPHADPAAAGIRPDAVAAAADYARVSRASAFLVWRAGALVAADYGPGVDVTTPLVSKSLSKPLATVAVGRAIALGRIASLDASVADYIPEWRGTAKAAIRVRHLLDMRAGLLPQMVSADPDHPVNRAYLDPHHDRVLVDDYPLVAPPGTAFGYSNATAELVAVLIERATGESYADFIGREVLAPLGAAGGDIWLDRPGGTAHSGCCMHLPAETWLRLGILLLDDGVVNGRRLLPMGFVTAMTAPTEQNPHFGLGVWIAGPYVERRGFTGPGGGGPQVRHGAPYRDRDLFLFDGNGDQVVYVSRAARLVAARLGDAPPAGLDWDNAVIPNLLIGGVVAAPGDAPLIPQPAATAADQKP